MTTNVANANMNAPSVLDLGCSHSVNLSGERRMNEADR
jgi:hypothetical protein